MTVSSNKQLSILFPVLFKGVHTLRWLAFHGSILIDFTFGPSKVPGYVNKWMQSIWKPQFFQIDPKIWDLRSPSREMGAGCFFFMLLLPNPIVGGSEYFPWKPIIEKTVIFRQLYWDDIGWNWEKNEKSRKSGEMQLKKYNFLPLPC